MIIIIIIIMKCVIDIITTSCGKGNVAFHSHPEEKKCYQTNSDRFKFQMTFLFLFAYFPLMVHYREMP